MAEDQKNKAHELLDEMATVIRETLIEEGIGEAVDLAPKLTEAIRKTFEGEPLYIPKLTNMAITTRDYEMWDEFKDGNYSYLSKKYNMTTRNVRTRLDMVRNLIQLKQQGSLFPG